MIQLYECVPNFSEGRDRKKMEAIVVEIKSVPGTVMLDLQMDPDHHRSVVTFVAAREAAMEAAFRAVKKAAELIDLNKHKGEHPRLGAADVIPFIPLQRGTMAEAKEMARMVAKRIGDDLKIPVFVYGEAALRPAHKVYAKCRKGDFEALRSEIGKSPEKTPDYGPMRVHPTAGACGVGARGFLIAFNVNLKTPDVEFADKISREIRSSGGGFKALQAKGFGIQDGKYSQVSMNLANYKQTGYGKVFDEIEKRCNEAGVEILESELIGMTPETALADLAKTLMSEQEYHLATRKDRVLVAVERLKIRNFRMDQVLEFQLEEKGGAPAPEVDVYNSPKLFMDILASKRPAPGGGSVAALAGSLGAALCTMVCNLTLGKKKYEKVEEEIVGLMEKTVTLKNSLFELIRADALAFDKVSAALEMPKGSDAEKATRKKALQEATKGAIETPLETMRLCLKVLELSDRIAEIGNSSAASDAGVSGLMAWAGLQAAHLNVKINLSGLSDADFSKKSGDEAFQMAEKGASLEKRILEKINGKIS